MSWRPDERALETVILVRRAITERAEQAHPPTTGARSAARPACSDGFDNIDGCPERGVYIRSAPSPARAAGAGWAREPGVRRALIETAAPAAPRPRLGSGPGPSPGRARR